MTNGRCSASCSTLERVKDRDALAANGARPCDLLGVHAVSVGVDTQAGADDFFEVLLADALARLHQTDVAQAVVGHFMQSVHRPARTLTEVVRLGEVVDKTVDLLNVTWLPAPLFSHRREAGAPAAWHPGIDTASPVTEKAFCCWSPKSGVHAEPIDRPCENCTRVGAWRFPPRADSPVRISGLPCSWGHVATQRKRPGHCRADVATPLFGLCCGCPRRTSNARCALPG